MRPTFAVIGVDFHDVERIRAFPFQEGGPGSDELRASYGILNEKIPRLVFVSVENQIRILDEKVLGTSVVACETAKRMMEKSNGNIATVFQVVQSGADLKKAKCQVLFVVSVVTGQNR